MRTFRGFGAAALLCLSTVTMSRAEVEWSAFVEQDGMAVAVAGVSLLVAAYGAARLVLPGLEAWGEGRELLLGAGVITVVFASFLLGLHLARRSALRQGVV